jgi:hypothetical protein
MLYSSQYGAIPGLTTATETYESALRWGNDTMGVLTGALISAGSLDPGNTPTTELRVGLVMGIITATGQWTNYAATNIDGSGVAQGILPIGLRTTDLLTGVALQRFYAMLVGGPVQASKLIGLDALARAQMADSFMFDDNFAGAHWFPWKQIVTKTANYTIQPSDNFTLFNNFGAVVPVTFTLPAIASGNAYYFGFSAEVLAQNLLVTSAEGGNIIGFNNITANTVAFQSGGAIAGGFFAIYNNPGSTKWIVENRSAGANTVTTS